MKGRPSCSACHGRECTPETKCAACYDVVAQARDWVRAHCPPSVSGAGGHSAAFRAACCICEGFDLAGETAYGVLAEWNGACAPPWSERELRHKLDGAMKQAASGERGGLIWGQRDRRPMPGGPGEAGHLAARERPAAEEKNWRPFDRAKLLAAARPGVRTDAAWLAERSSADPGGITPEQFLCGLYQPGERVLVCTRYKGPGEYLCVVPGGEREREAGIWRLGKSKGIPAERVESLPRTASCGVWFLAQPVTGQWVEKTNWAGGKADGYQYTRRSEPNVTRWPYMVLECDEEGPGIQEAWVNYLCQLPLPIVAMYTSGGRSVHALVRVDMRRKTDWDTARDYVKPLLTIFGADKGVFSAVRLTRLPGCERPGKEGHDGKYVRFETPRAQRLIFWRPEAVAGDGCVMTLPRRRAVGAGEGGKTADGADVFTDLRR